MGSTGDINILPFIFIAVSSSDKVTSLSELSPSHESKQRRFEFIVRQLAALIVDCHREQNQNNTFLFKLN